MKSAKRPILQAAPKKGQDCKVLVLGLGSLSESIIRSSVMVSGDD